jgi:hypothetical protein
MFISCHVSRYSPIRKYSHYSMLKSELPAAYTQQGQISVSHSIHGFMKLLFTHQRNNDFTRDKQQDSGRDIDFKIQECFSGVCIFHVKLPYNS